MLYPIAEIDGVTLILSGFGFAELETCMRWIASEAPEAFRAIAECKPRGAK